MHVLKSAACGLVYGLLFLIGASACAAHNAAQDGNISAAPAAPGNRIQDDRPTTNLVSGDPLASQEKDKDEDWGWLKALLPVAAGAVAVLATQWITARTSRRIAAEQAEINRAGLRVAEENAASAAASSRAAERGAEAALENARAATRNAANTGTHATARLRQDWINGVRDELSRAHTLLVNYRDPPFDESEQRRVAREQLQREANAVVAKIQLLLNPAERPSRNLLIAIRRLEKSRSLQDRRRRGRWVIRWGQIVLKTEWDRVRAELGGKEWSPPAWIRASKSLQLPQIQD